MANNRRIVNFQQLREKRDQNAPVVVDPDGKEHVVGVVSLDFQLEFLSLQQDMGDFKTTRDALKQAAEKEAIGEVAENGEIVGDAFLELSALLARAQSLVAKVLPRFPSGSLDMEELSMLLSVCMSGKEPPSPEELAAMQAEGAKEEDGKGEPGESTRPQS